MFREFLHFNFEMTEDILMDRIYKLFTKATSEDIDVQEWILGFNIFLKGIRITNFILFIS